MSKKYSLNFGQALEAVKLGKLIYRENWNGKGMFVYYVPANSYPADRNKNATLKGIFADNLVPYRDYLAMKTVDNQVVPWVASQTDILAEDWNIFGETNE